MKKWIRENFGWKFSLAWIVWMSAASALSHFHDVHPWQNAFWLWYAVPWTGLFGYLFGRMDAKREQTQREIDTLDKEIKELQIMRMRTHFNFNDPKDSN